MPDQGTPSAETFWLSLAGAASLLVDVGVCCEWSSGRIVLYRGTISEMRGLGEVKAVVSGTEDVASWTPRRQGHIGPLRNQHMPCRGAAR
jgi:hypothetical protein